MQFWEPSLVVTVLALGALLGVGLLVRRVVPVPASIVAGTLGLVLGPGVLGVIPFDVDALETGVYHALAVVFIALGLQRPTGNRSRGGGARTMAFGISTMVSMQTAVGLGVALALAVHPGFGLLLPLGFEQGPGQAMALGAAWQQAGMPDGAQVGLIIAAIGFAWAVFAGVPLVLVGRRLGWVSDDRDPLPPPGTTFASTSALTAPLALIALVYVATWGACVGLSSALADLPEIAAMMWGFHYLWGALIASLVRFGIDRVGAGALVDDAQLSAISATVVDFATTAALAAVQIAVLAAFWLPIVSITTAGGVATLIACVWLARRGFARAPFEHAVLWFGMSTGTLPVGLALLRMVDPDLRSPVPSSAVYGSALSILGVGPVVLLLHPLAIAGHPEQALGLCIAWLIVLLGAWWGLAGLRLRPLRT